MRFRHLLALTLITAACAGPGEPPHHLSMTSPVVDDRPMQLAARAEHEQLAAFYRLLLERAWYDGLNKNHGAIRQVRAPREPLGPSLTPDNSGAAPSCTTNTPLPASVIQGESGGRCDAYNPTGCGGRGCIGYAQLDAGHFAAVSPWNPNVHGTCYGLSYDACVNKLWNGGSGAAHWGR